MKQSTSLSLIWGRAHASTQFLQVAHEKRTWPSRSLMAISPSCHALINHILPPGENDSKRYFK
jgi:hypothetical protein